jgi:FdhE protein
MTIMATRLLDLARSRWQDIVSERPDLAPAVALQERLLTRVARSAEALETAGLAELDFPAPYLTRKLERGIPMLNGESIPIPAAELAPRLTEHALDLADGGAGDAARHVAEAISSGRIEPGSLLRASLARNQDAVRMASNQIGLSADLLWLVGELAVSPYAHLVGAAFGRTITSTKPDGYGHVWDRGYCPTCGSWPALAELTADGRVVACSFCSTTWQPGHRCTYCREDGERFIVLAPNPERPDRLVELCEHCRGYLKSTAVARPVGFPLVAVEDLATVDLDQEAIGRGFHRPDMPSSYPD